MDCVRREEEDGDGKEAGAGGEREDSEGATDNGERGGGSTGVGKRGEEKGRATDPPRQPHW